jgi:uncharacterized protein YndB with AHSA1/START domain
MPTSKDLKRLTRSRMKKTGESYTTARARLRAKKRSDAPGTPEPDHAARAGMSDEAVRAKTGHVWKEWVRLLDARGAADMPHREIARCLHDHFDVPAWWTQMVAVGYERIQGRRDVGQASDGAYRASKSKTLPVPVKKLYRAFSEARTRNRWLKGVKMKIRTARPDQSIRITWEDGTSVEATFTAKGDGKSQVAIEHRKLPAKSDVAKAKAYWTERLDLLARVLTPPKR